MNWKEEYDKKSSGINKRGARTKKVSMLSPILQSSLKWNQIFEQLYLYAIEHLQKIDDFSSGISKPDGIHETKVH